MIRPSRPLAAIALAVVLTGGAALLSGCSVVQNAVEGASGGEVDVGGRSIPKDYPKADVPLIDGDVVYGAAVANDGARVWNVTVKVADRSATQTITQQLTAAGFTATASAGTDATGDTAALQRGDYTVIVAVTQPSGGGDWVANYTVTKTAGSASPAPTPTG